MFANKRVFVAALMCTVMAVPIARGTETSPVDPEVIIRAGVDRLADAAAAYHLQSENHEEVLAEEIRRFLADYTDIRAAARLILSKSWKDANAEQRSRFESAFNNRVTRLLVDRLPMVDFDSVRIEPFVGVIDDQPLEIRLRFHTNRRQLIHFVLVMHEDGERLLVFDVIAEGVSYVKLFRTQFAGEISERGLEASIERFEERTRQR